MVPSQVQGTAPITSPAPPGVERHRITKYSKAVRGSWGKAQTSLDSGCNVSLTFSTETISTALLKCKVREALRLLEARLA